MASSQPMSQPTSPPAIVFVGPTLDRPTAENLLDAVYLPPASKGDIYRVAQRRPQAIGIIDGYFERVLSVWHKEILWAMSQGIHVFGSASMGALRAAELASFGMIGVGEIYDALASGELEDDDEVTIAHGSNETGFRPHSEAMVNIRCTLAAAQRQSIVSQPQLEVLVQLAKGRFYPHRNYEDLLQLARRSALPAEVVDRLEAWLPEGRIDQKRRDAIAMLRQMQQLLETSAAPKKVRFTLQRTLFWEELTSPLQRHTAPLSPEAESDLPDAFLEELKLRGTPYLEERQQALYRATALHLAQQHRLETETDSVQETTDAYRQRYGLLDASALEDWQETQHLSAAGFQHLMRDQRRLQQVDSLSRPGLGPHLKDHLKARGAYGALHQRYVTKQRILRNQGLSNPSLAVLGLEEEALWVWYFEEHLDEAVPEDLDAYAQRFDFGSVQAFRSAVLGEYCFQQHLESTDL